MLRADPLGPQGDFESLRRSAQPRHGERKSIQTAREVRVDGAETLLAYIHSTAEIALGAIEVTLFVSQFSEITENLAHTPGIWAGLLSELECTPIIFHGLADAVYSMRQIRLWALESTALAVALLASVLTPATAAAVTYRVLHQFTGPDGSTPYSGLVRDASGNLYGTTSLGGPNSNGTVFKLTLGPRGSWTESVLYSFIPGPGGYFPVAGLTLDSAGNLYGSTAYGGDLNCDLAGCGIIFKLTHNSDGSWAPSVLHTFNGADGNGPYGNVIFDAAGNLYGTTTAGGDSLACSRGCGVAFRLAPNSDGTWTESILHSFSGPDGQLPWAALVFDAAGNLYSTTVMGGNYGGGTFFKLAPNSDGSWTQSVLWHFSGFNGTSPYDPLVFDNAGHLFGTTGYGGNSSCGCGVIFRFARGVGGSWEQNILQTLAGTPGATPVGGLAFDAAGNLYGTTFAGGPSGGGTVFKMTHNSAGRGGPSTLPLFSGAGGPPILSSSGRGPGPAGLSLRP